MKINLFRFYYLVFCFTGYVFNVNAQTNNIEKNTYNQVSIASPTAGSLGKYADIPVHYHTGIPQISIPVYTVKSGTLSLPINLSYHASGLKVQEPASWVGAGWTLNAGGVITRTVIGAPDEKGTNNAGTETHGHFSNYGYNNYVNYNGQQDWQAFANGWKDGEPDLYFFNFGGYTGKFYFNDDRTPVIVPEQDFKIVPSYTDTGSIKSFVITTPDGVQYYFGNSAGITGALPIEKTNSVTAQNGLSTGTVISSWYLNKIVSADNQFTISLSYTAEKYGYFTIAMFAVNGTATGSDGYGYNLVKNVLNGVRLKKITFPNGYINFTEGSIRTDLSNDAALMTDSTNQEATRLAAIQITDSSFCKQYKFSYGYFQDTTSPLNGTGITSMNYTLQTDKYRLRLDSIQEISCDSSLNVPPYKFSYFSEKVPRRLTFGIDHWGFYNGVTNNGTLIPTYTLIATNNTQIITGANRDASWPALRGGTLEQITYPTGGFSKFDFETNDVYTSYSRYDKVGLTNLVVHQFGQSAITQTTSFTLSGSGDCVISINNNSSSWSPTFSIKNSSNTVVYNSGGINVSSSFTTTLQLAAGNYQATLAFPTGFDTTSSGGADGSVSQWQYVTVTGTKTAGGMRIKTLTHNDGVTSNDNITTYGYQTSGTSTAVLYSRPAYVGIVRNDLIKDVGYWTTSGFTPYASANGCPAVGNATYYKSPNSIRPMGTTQGNPIGYSQVQVSQNGNGYSIYQYYGNNGNNQWLNSTEDVAITTVNTVGCDANAPNYPSAPLPFEFLRGELKSEAHYNQSDQLLKDATYTPVYESRPVTIPGFLVVWREGQLLGTKYDLVNGRKTKVTTVKTDYTPGSGSIVTTSIDNYQSLYHHQLSSTQTTSSKGDSIKTNMKYGFDFRIAACDSIGDGWQTYQNDGSTCQSQFTTAANACNNNASCLTSAYLTFLNCKTTARINYVSYRRTNFTDTTNAFKTAHNNAKASAGTELKPILELQDEYNNPAIEVSNWKNNNLIGATFNRFDYSSNPSDKVYLNKTQSINLSAPSNTFTNAATNSSSIFKDSRYEDDASFKFDAGNLTELTKKDGLLTTYIWGYNNAYPIAQVINASAASIAHTSFESDSKGNWTYSGTVSTDTTSPTGTKRYSLSSGNITKSGLTSGTTYIVSYWSRNGSYTLTGSNTPKQGKTIDDWTYYEHEITGTTSLTISGSGYIDELRFYPKGALMTTYTYIPLVGMSSQCDAGNRINYYKYDGLGRLKLIKDQDKNILKTFDYQYRQSQ